MKTDREYPAAFTSYTAWYGVDKDGEIAIFGTEAPGSAPKKEWDNNCWPINLFLYLLTNADLTDNQLDAMMANSVTPAELGETNQNRGNLNYIIVQFAQAGDKEKVEKLAPEYAFNSISRPRNIYLFEILDIDPKQKEMALTKRGKIKHFIYFVKMHPSLFSRLLFVDHDITKGYSAAESRGYMRRCDVPLYIYQHPDTEYYFTETRMGYPSAADGINRNQVTPEIREMLYPLAVRLRKHPFLQLNLCTDWYAFDETDDYIIFEDQKVIVMEVDNAELMLYSFETHEPVISFEEAYKQRRLDIDETLYRINGRFPYRYNEGYEQYERLYNWRDYFDANELPPDAIEEVKPYGDD